METILADLVAAVVDPGLQERAFLAVGAKSSVFQSLQDCFNVGEMVVIVDSSSRMLSRIQCVSGIPCSS